MLKSFSEKIFQGLTGIKPDRLVLSEAERNEIIYKAKRVRSKDYVFRFTPETHILGQPKKTYEKTVTTTARWKFICTGVAFDADNDYIRATTPPTIGIRFDSLASQSPFRSQDAAQMNRVLAQLVIPIEGKKEQYFPGCHFEEYKNLFFVLDQRVNITVSLQAGSVADYHATVIMTGIEVFEGSEDE